MVANRLMLSTQGYILEASPLPKLPVVDLQPIPFPENTITVSLNHQSVEEENINGADTSIEYNASFRRYPFVVLLDGVVSSHSIFTLEPKITGGNSD